MKYIGLTALCLALSLIGVYLSSVHKKRYSLLFAISEFFKEFAVCSSLVSLDVYGCIEKLSRRKSLAILTFLCSFKEGFTFGCNIRKLWHSCVEKCSELNLLDKNDIEMLLSFSDIFGKCSFGEFSEKCLEYSAFFLEKAKKEELSWNKNRAATVGSCLFSAAAVFIMIV